MRRSLLLPALVVAACSSDPARTTDTGGPAGDAGPRADAPATHDTGFPLDGMMIDDDAGTMVPDSGEEDAGMIVRDPNCPAAAHWVHTVRGRIVDQTGAASSGAKAQFCARTAPSGTLLCLRPVDSNADGTFEIHVAAQARCNSEATMRFVRPLEDFGVSYCALDQSSNADSLEIATPYHVYAATRATTVPPLGDETMRRTVRFADGLEMDIVPHDYFPGSGTYADLAAAVVPTAGLDACILAGEPSFDGLYAFSPEGDTNGSLPLRVPNGAGLAANRAVRVFVLGGLSCTLGDGTILQEGRWHELARTAVSADGMTIPVADAPCLSWLAYRGD